MTCAIVATARNEGPFLLEWLSHHFAIGIDKVFVATNHCDDGTDLLLQELGRRYPIHHIDNSVPIERLTFQRSAVRRALAHPAMDGIDWILHIDLDEFVNLTSGARCTRDFLADFADADAVVLQWRLFGDGGRTFWDGGSVLESFVACQSEPHLPGHKVVFKRLSFGDAAPHAPKEPLKPVDQIRIVTTENTLLEPGECASTLPVPEDLRTWTGACVNHYMHKSQDLVHLSRKLRGDANGRNGAWRRRTVGHKYYEQYNCNDAVDLSIHTFRNERVAIMNEMMSDPRIRSLHYDAQAWFANALVTEIGTDPEQKDATLARTG